MRERGSERRRERKMEGVRQRQGLHVRICI